MCDVGFFLRKLKVFSICYRRQDSSIGFGAPIRANMRAGGVIDAAVASSLMETVSAHTIFKLTA